jgi:hypothetical protein
MLIGFPGRHGRNVGRLEACYERDPERASEQGGKEPAVGHDYIVHGI